MISASWKVKGLAAAVLLLGLAACSSNPQAQQPEAVQQASLWLCDGMDVMQTRSAVNKLWLQLPGSEDWLELPQARAASGALYSNGQGSSFWNRDERARVTTPEREWLNCQLQATGEVGSLELPFIPGSNTSPEAVTLRASGHNPGWTLIIRQNGTGELLHNFGTRRTSLKKAEQVHQDLIRRQYRIQDEQGQTAEYTVENILCVEVGTGEPFPHRVTLEYQGHQYRGCGQSF
ncbi:MliC family protein [Marinospirillum alkaliphilum]|uniref:Membrane-bound lysozyme-inhibitor of c-type lysozyme n=1 Tax=Marinospirillum alkaliphilum DSM 21637 TaxID=1122209 RepID=A0A1K1V840_9GAMM|nr:MliC family protein [Marinospirillum alkaliphilum]SFX20725.1 Membrane-bound lysozyme-inhibitor of c-type lysozyme [Marinospirillum alkaliphilum DSM 21637]